MQLHSKQTQVISLLLKTGADWSTVSILVCTLLIQNSMIKLN